MRADLEWFRTFKAIFDTETMSDAAKELNISQPGVSLHLSSLENYIGHPLFERNTRKMIPNERARMLYRQICYSLTKLEEVENSVRKRSGKERMTLCLGVYSGLFSQLIAPHIADLDFNLIVQFGDNDKLSELLESGSVDIIITSTETPIHNISYQVLGTSEFIVAAGKETDISQFQQLDIENKGQVRKWLQSQLWYSNEKNIWARFWKLNFKKESDFAPNYVMPDKNTILRCLEKGVGLALMPHSVCRDSIERGDIICLWKGYVEMKNTLYIGHRKNSILSDEIQQIKEIMTTEFEKCHNESCQPLR